MCFYRIMKGQSCIGEGIKTWGHGNEQAILSGQHLGYLCLLIFSEKRNRLTCYFFYSFFFFFFWTMSVLFENRNPKTNICHLIFYRAANMMIFAHLFNVGKGPSVTP